MDPAVAGTAAGAGDGAAARLGGRIGVTSSAAMSGRSSAAGAGAGAAGGRVRARAMSPARGDFTVPVSASRRLMLSRRIAELLRDAGSTVAADPQQVTAIWSSRVW